MHSLLFLFQFCIVLQIYSFTFPLVALSSIYFSTLDLAHEWQGYIKKPSHFLYVTSQYVILRSAGGLLVYQGSLIIILRMSVSQLEVRDLMCLLNPLYSSRFANASNANREVPSIDNHLLTINFPGVPHIQKPGQLLALKVVQKSVLKAF